MDAETYQCRILRGIHDVDAAAWDACAGAANPFVSHAFLSALEDSGSAGPRTGWAPCHVLLEGAGGRVIGAAPLYLKSHSYGEYVFDHGWAQAYERAGGRYYPKLQCAIPFTPATGPRLLVPPAAPEEWRVALLAGMDEYARRLGVSSLHVTFATEAESRLMAEHGYLERLGLQFHWQNRGYGSFDDFLADLASRKRKQIRRERAAALASGIEVRQLTGEAIEAHHWDAFHRFYLATVDRKWGSAYLTRRFFDLLTERLPDRVLLVMAFQHGRPIAGAFNLIGDDTLYGRNWGAGGDFPFLHFEVCYYQALDFAIARGLSRVEAGAQGEHKLQRGYLPCPTYSGHWIADPGFARAVERFLAAEREGVLETIAAYAEHAPHRQG